MPCLAFAGRIPVSLHRGHGFFTKVSILGDGLMTKSAKVTSIHQHVKNQNNNYENVEQINNYYGEKKDPPIKNNIIPPDGSIQGERRKEILDLTKKLGQVQTLVSGHNEYGLAQHNFKTRFGISSYAELPNDRFSEGREWLIHEINQLVTHENVIKAAKIEKNMLWWENFLTVGIQTRRKKTVSTESDWYEWLLRRFGESSISDFPHEKLADLFKVSLTFGKSKSKKLPEKKDIAGDKRVLQLRAEAIIKFIHEQEAADPYFDRLNIEIGIKGMLSELKKTDRSLFSISEGSFINAIKEAKKIMIFNFKRGTKKRQSE